MSEMFRFKNEFAGRADSEHEQAFLRVVIVSFFAFQMYLFVGPREGWTEVERTLSTGLFGFLLIAIGIFAAIYLWPAKSVARRIAGMLADVGFATFYVWLAGENGAFMIVIYLFVTLGNGFRYGRRYIFACQAMSIIGFGAAGFFVPYWQEHHTTWLAFLSAIFILPLYVSALLKRIELARDHAKEALKECLERNAT